MRRNPARHEAEVAMDLRPVQEGRTANRTLSHSENDDSFQTCDKELVASWFSA